MKQDYKQYYTCSLFNIKNNIDFSQKTIFINIFTNEDLEVFNKINDKIVIYNNELHFFNYLNIVNKVIQSKITIYSDNTKIRQYLFKNGCNSRFIDKDKYESTIIINSYSPTETDLINSINSCLKQENVIIKIIIVTIEDDITIKIVNDNYSSNNNITVIVVKKKDNPGKGPKGIYYQLNQAFLDIKTRFVSYFSSNDIMYPTKIMNELNCLLNNDAIFCFSKYVSIFPDTNEKQPYNYKNIMNYENLLKGNYVNDCATIDISKLDKKIEFNYEKYGNTCYWHLWLSLLQKYGEKCMYYNNNIEWEYICDKTKSQAIDRKKNINKTELYYNQIEFMLSEFKNNIKPNSVYKYNLSNQKFWWWNDITNKKPVELTIALPALNANQIIWLALESLKNQTNINFAWELIVFEEEGISKEIVQSYKGLLPGCVRIIYKTITKDDAFYKIEDIQENKCTSYYTLLEKWINIAKISDKNSKIFVKHSVDCYSSPKRLYIHYEHFKNDMCYYSTQPKGYFYNMSEDKWLLYDGYKLEPNNIIKGCHLNIALRTNIMKLIDLPEKQKQNGLNGYILYNVIKIINIKPEEIKIIFTDNEIDSENWKYSLCIDGYNNISLLRKKLYSDDNYNSHFIQMPNYKLNDIHINILNNIYKNNYKKMLNIIKNSNNNIETDDYFILKKNNLNNNVKVTVGLPALNSSKIIWLALESLKLQNIDDNWELIVIEENNESRDLVKKYFKLFKNCVKIIYINIDSKHFNKFYLVDKWLSILYLSLSNILVLQAADCYSSPNRLQIHIKHFNDTNIFLSTQKKGLFLNLTDFKKCFFNGEHLIEKNI